MAYSTGLVTGLQGYSLKKEMLADALMYREVQTFSYEVYSLDMVNMSPATVHSRMLNEFSNRYSGDINVKVFSIPTDYFFPNDSVRVAKYNVEVQVRSVPALSTWFPELNSTYYKGLDTAFFTSYGASILDLKEGFDFEVGDNGTHTFSHNVSFGLITGSKAAASGVAQAIFGQDKDTTFGINVMIGEITELANTGLVQNYYTETYDTIRGQYSFSRKREVLPSGAAAYSINMQHVLDLKEDGIVEVSEKGNVKGKLNFAGAQAGAENQLSQAYGRCNTIFQTYAPIANPFTPISNALVQTPHKITRMFNRPALAVDYEVSYTNSPLFASDGTTTEETFDLNDVEIGIVDCKHTFNFTRNKRVTADNKFEQMIANAIASSPATVDAYFAVYYPSGPTWPMHLVKREFSWPVRDSNGARVLMQYNNHPKYFVSLNGLGFYTLEHKVQFTMPVDITTEYKVINRPSKMSLINYAYQTEKGKVVITVDAGIGRKSDEFVNNNFRTDLGGYLNAMYQFAVQQFFLSFKITPLAFTYYLSDVKYTYNSDNGALQLTTSFDYTVKRYVGG